MSLKTVKFLAFSLFCLIASIGFLYASSYSPEEERQNPRIRGSTSRPTTTTRTNTMDIYVDDVESSREKIFPQLQTKTAYAYAPYLYDTLRKEVEVVQTRVREQMAEMIEGGETREFRNVDDLIKRLTSKEIRIKIEEITKDKERALKILQHEVREDFSNFSSMDALNINNLIEREMAIIEEICLKTYLERMIKEIPIVIPTEGRRLYKLLYLFNLPWYNPKGWCCCRFLSYICSK